MKLIVATSPEFFVEENAILDELFKEGLDGLHIRKPNSEPIYCERLLTLTKPMWYSRIVVEDHFYLKSEYNLKGIHLNPRNPNMPYGYKGFFSRSCDLYDIENWKEQCGYVFLDINPEVLHRAEADNHIDKKVFARGIKSVDDVKLMKRLGFGGVVLDDILWNQFDFHESSNYTYLIDFYKKIKKAAE